jgi:hypothetical protein
MAATHFPTAYVIIINIFVASHKVETYPKHGD